MSNRTDRDRFSKQSIQFMVKKDVEIQTYIFTGKKKKMKFSKIGFFFV